MQGLKYTQFKFTGTVYVMWKTRDAQRDHRYGQLKEMLAFWKGLPFLKLSAASSETEGLRKSSTQSILVASF